MIWKPPNLGKTWSEVSFCTTHKTFKKSEIRQFNQMLWLVICYCWYLAGFRTRWWCWNPSLTISGLLKCTLPHFLRRLYRVCGNKPSDIVAPFLLKALCLLALQNSFSLLGSMMPLRRSSTVLPHFLYIMICSVGISWEFHQKCRTVKEIHRNTRDVLQVLLFFGRSRFACFISLFVWSRSPPRSNMEPEDDLCEEEKHLTKPSFWGSMLVFRTITYASSN